MSENLNSNFLVKQWSNVSQFWEANAGNYFNSFIAIVLVLFITYISLKILQTLTRKAITRQIRKNIDEQHVDKSLQAKTLLPLILSVERYTIYFIGFIVILKEMGIDTSAIIASAGVMGIAIGFGAQNTVKDFISGFFLIFDGLIMVEDTITIDSITGTVEKIDLRNTMIRDFNGRLWTLPNGDVRVFGNYSRQWVRAIANVGMAYEQNIDEGIKALKDVAEKWAEEFKSIVVEPPEVQGVISLDDSSVALRIIVKVKTSAKWSTERELLRRIKDHFDQKGIEIPFPRRVMISKAD